MIKFYASEYHNTGLDQTEGGRIDTANPLSGDMGELLSFYSPITGVEAQYRKIHIRNEGYVKLTGIKVWLGSVDHTGQLALGTDYAPNQYIGAAVYAPTGVGFTGYSSYTSGMSLNDLLPFTSTGFWIREYFSGISGQDLYATARLGIGYKE